MNLTVQSPTQIAWVTPDLDATETALTGLLGVRKWVRIPDVHFAPDTCSYHGKPADFLASISLSYLGDMQLELIQPVSGENVYSDFLRDRRAGSAPHLHGGRQPRSSSTRRWPTPPIVAPRWCSRA